VGEVIEAAVEALEWTSTPRFSPDRLAGARAVLLPSIHGCLHRRQLLEGAAGWSFDVLDAWRRVHVELPSAFAQQKLDCAKVSLVNLGVLFELGSIILISMGTIDGFRGTCLPRKDLEALAACFGLFAALANALPIQGKHLFLES
jgi:hypothetical protein